MLIVKSAGGGRACSRHSSSMSEATSNSELSKHIKQNETDIVSHFHHRKFDVEIRELLRYPANRELRNPKTRSDYHNLVALVIKNYNMINHQFDKNVNSIKANYTDDNVRDEVWSDFKRMVDMCLGHGRFRDIRILCELIKAFIGARLAWTWKHTNNSLQRTFMRRISISRTVLVL